MPRAVRRPARTRRALVGLAALTLLAAGCGGAAEEGGEGSAAATSTSAPSDGGGSGSAASDDGGATAGDKATAEESASAEAPAEAIEVTPAPEGFAPPEPCTGEGAHAARLDEGPADPALPERAGETVTVTVTGVDGDHAELEAAIGEAEPRPLGPITLGETATLNLWTISVTSVCEDTGQVEFDLID